VLGVVVVMAAVKAHNGVTLRLGAQVVLKTTSLVNVEQLLTEVLAGAAGVRPALRAARLAPTVALRWS
jgi:hypothetical protein